jgi:membrane protein
MRRVPTVRELHAGIEDHELLNSASAIAFQVVTALVPVLLVLLALLGFLDLERVWVDVAAELRPQVSDAAFTVVDDTVRNVLENRQWFWLTAGALFAVWRLSAAMRAVMGALGSHLRRRPASERCSSVCASRSGLAIAVALLLLLALAVVHLGPLVVSTEGVLSIVSLVVRWAVAGLLLLLAVGLTIHYAPATPQPLGWVSFGSLSAVGAWLIGSLLFVLYITEVASYGSLFGSLATIFVLLTYLYTSAIALLIGVEIDTQVRRRVDGTPHGDDTDEPEPARVSGARAAA